MTTTNPLDRIVVGKQYRYVPRPTPEFLCPAGGHIMGLSRLSIARAGHIVTIQGTWTKSVWCSDCDGHFPAPSGTYSVTFEDGELWATIYPWLQPLEPSGPEPRGG